MYLHVLLREGKIRGYCDLFFLEGAADKMN